MAEFYFQAGAMDSVVLPVACDPEDIHEVRARFVAENTPDVCVLFEEVYPGGIKPLAFYWDGQWYDISA